MSDVSGRRGRPATGVREAVLRATEELLGESGAARLSTKDIARRASVAESSIFYHFTDRIGLLKAVVDTRLPAHRERLAALVERAGSGDLRGNLLDLLAGLEDFYVRIAPILAAVQADTQLRELFAERGRTTEVGPLRGLRPIAEYLDRERLAGRIRADADVRSAAELLLSVAYQRATLARPLGRTGDQKSVVDTVLGGIAAG